MDAGFLRWYSFVWYLSKHNLQQLHCWRILCVLFIWMLLSMCLLIFICRLVGEGAGAWCIYHTYHIAVCMNEWKRELLPYSSRMSTRFITICPTAEFHLAMLIVKWKPCYIDFTRWFEYACSFNYKYKYKYNYKNSNHHCSYWMWDNIQIFKNPIWPNWGNEAIFSGNLIDQITFNMIGINIDASKK